jgi:hypothetical protein
MLAYKGSRCIAQLILNLGPRGRQHHTPAVCTREKNPGTHSICSWMGPRADLEHLEQKKTFTLPEFETLFVLSLAYSQPRLHCPRFFIAIISVEMYETDFYLNYIFQYFYTPVMFCYRTSSTTFYCSKPPIFMLNWSNLMKICDQLTANTGLAIDPSREPLLEGARGRSFVTCNSTRLCHETRLRNSTYLCSALAPHPHPRAPQTGGRCVVHAMVVALIQRKELQTFLNILQQIDMRFVGKNLCFYTHASLSWQHFHM